MSVDLFFIERGDQIGAKAAKAVCARCYVRDECLTDAIINVEREGIFGGTTPRERKTIRVALGIEPRDRDFSSCGTVAAYQRGCRCQPCIDAEQLRHQLKREAQPRSACAS